MENRRGEAIYPDEGLVLLVGKSGSLKSFVTLYHAYAMAREGKRVAMFLMEGFRGYRQRIIAHESHHEVAGKEPWLDNIIYFDGRAVRELPLDLGVILQTEALRRVIEPFEPDSIDVAFVDTFRSAASIENENNNAEVGAILQRAQLLATTVVLVHHTRKNDKDVYAGAGAMETNSHAHIVITYDKDTKLVRMQCLNTKDDRQFSDTYYKAAAVGDSIAISELTDDQISGVRARATANKSERRRNEKDETYFGMLRQEKEMTKAEMAEDSGESQRTVARWLHEAIKRGKVQESGKQGHAKTYSLTTAGADIPF